MAPKLLVFFFSVLLVQIQKSSQCGCNFGKSVSPPALKSGPLVVRPVELPKIVPALPTKPKIVCKVVGGSNGLVLPPLKPSPIGDLCSCKKTIVTPAVVPKPAATTYSSKTTLNSQLVQNLATTTIMKGGLIPPPPPPQVVIAQPPPQPQIGVVYQQMPPTSVYLQPEPPSPIPADPVSLSLAYQMAQKACKASEDRLSFGFKTLPKEIPVSKPTKRVIAEENLYGLNGRVLELKPIPCVTLPKTLEEEAAEGLMMETIKEATRVRAAQKQVTLGDLGYGPASVKPCPVVTIAGTQAGLAAASAAATNMAAAYSSTTTKKICNDGFVPGQVYSKTVMKPEAYRMPVTAPPPCSEEDFSPSLLPTLPTLPKAPVMSYSTSSSSCGCHKQSSSLTLSKF